MANFNFTNYADVDYIFPYYDYKKTVRTQPITRITLHHTACRWPSLSYFERSLRNRKDGSWNYGIDMEGHIGLFVQEKYAAWTSSSTINDRKAVTVEVSNTVNYSDNNKDWPISDRSMASVVNLCVSVCYRNGITKLVHKPKTSGGPDPKFDNGSNLTMHKWFGATECPGPYFSRNFPNIVNLVNERLKNPGKIKALTAAEVENGLLTHDVATADNWASSVVDTILDSTSPTPYVIRLDRNSPDPDYDALQQLRVAGAIIEAGQMITDSGVVLPITQFLNPKLHAQVAALSDHDMYYGLYMKSNAKTLDDVDTECAGLKSAIRMHPPKLGVWIRFDFRSDNKKKNDQIVAQYDKNLVAINRNIVKGFYCTEEQLERFSWKDFCTDWYVWLVNHETSMTDLYADPEDDTFFTVGGDS